MLDIVNNTNLYVLSRTVLQIQRISGYILTFNRGTGSDKIKTK